MTPDEQALEAVRHSLVSVCVALLPSGMIGITSGFNPRRALAILPPTEALDFILALRQSEPPPPTRDVLADLDPFDI